MNGNAERETGAADTETLRLYAPLTGRIFEPDENGDMTDMYGEILYGSQMTEYLDDISEFMERMQDVPAEAERGLMAYYDEPDGVNEKVLSLKVKIECRDGELWGVAECRVRGELTPEELDALKQFTLGEYSDGYATFFVMPKGSGENAQMTAFSPLAMCHSA